MDEVGPFGESSAVLTSRDFLTGFLILEPCSAFVTTVSLLVASKFSKAVGIDLGDFGTSFQTDLTFALASWLALCLAYFSDNFLGSKKTTVITGVLASVVPVLCVVSGISQIYRNAEQLHMMLVVLLVNTYFILYSFNVLWRILVVEQVALPDEKCLARRYLAKIECLSLMGTICATLTAKFTLYVLTVELISLILHIVMISMVVLFRHNIYSEPVEFNIVNQYFVKWFKQSRNLVVKIVRPNRQFDKIAEGNLPSRKIINIFLLCAISFPFIVVQHVLWFTATTFHAAYVSKALFIYAHVDPDILSSCVKILTILCLEYLVFPTLKLCKIGLSYFHVLLIVYLSITLGVLVCSITENKVDLDIDNIIDFESIAQFRIYNLKSGTINVSSPWFPPRIIDSWESLNILTIKMLGETDTQSLTVLDLETGVEVEFQNVTIIRGQSLSCLISPEGITMLRFPDIINSNDLPLKTVDKNMAKLYIATPNTNEGISEMVIWLFEQQMGESVEIKFPEDKNTTIRNVNAGVYNVAIRLGLQEKHHHLGKELKIDKGAVYLLLFMWVENHSRPYMHLFTVLTKSEVSHYWIVLELFLLDFSDVLLKVYLFAFVYLETPPKIRACLLCLVFAFSRYGFGYKFLLEKERLTYMQLITYTFIALISLFFYVSVATKYESDGRNKYIYDTTATTDPSTQIHFN